MKKLFALVTLFVFIGLVGFSQGTTAQFRKESGKSWFKDFQTYNGFGTGSPTYPWHFVGNMYINGNVKATTYGTAAVTDVQLGYVSGVTSAIQTQFAAKLAKADSNANKGYVGWYTYNATIILKAPLMNPSFGGQASAPYVTADSTLFKFLKLTALAAADTAKKRTGIFLIGTGLYFGNGTYYLLVR